MAVSQGSSRILIDIQMMEKFEKGEFKKCVDKYYPDTNIIGSNPLTKQIFEIIGVKPHYFKIKDGKGIRSFV